MKIHEMKIKPQIEKLTTEKIKITPSHYKRKEFLKGTPTVNIALWLY